MNRSQEKPVFSAKGGRTTDNRSVLVYIRGIISSLSPTERIIAEYILEDPERILYQSVAAMKREAGASVGSIVGCCRKLGVGGFANLKIALARELAGHELGNNFNPSKVSVVEQVFRLHTKSLAETRQINAESTMLEAARAIMQARRIYLFSTGISHAVAYAGYCKFRLLGMAAFTEADAHMQLISATQLGKSDLAMGISCSGRTDGTVRCLEVAHKRGARTICLTNSIRSPITNFADIALYATPSEVKYFQAPLASRVTQLAVLDALFVTIAVMEKARTVRQLRQIGEQLIQHRVP
jgi:RpiR family carbohydrate utilization transcriptional regulator